MPTIRLLLALSLCASVAGCRNRDDAGESRRVPVRFSRAADTGAAKLEMHDGDVRIASTDGDLDLALIGDTISSGLSQRALAKVRRETDTAGVTGSGFGAGIERMVKGTVQSAVAMRMVFPLADVRDVHYDGRKLVFEWNGKPQGMGRVSHNGKDFFESFSAEDSQRFVDAVRARKRSADRR